MMRLRIAAASLAATAALAFASSAGAALIGIYRDGMESDAQRAQIVKLSGERCGRGGSDHAIRIVVGKTTKECAYRTPVVGRDPEVGPIGRLRSRTPLGGQRRGFLSANLRPRGAGPGLP